MGALGVDERGVIGNGIQVALIKPLQVVHQEGQALGEEQVHGHAERVLVAQWGGTLTAYDLRGDIHGGDLFAGALVDQFKEQAAAVQGKVREFHQADAPEFKLDLKP